MARQLLVQATRPTSATAEWELLVPYGRWEHPRYGTVDNTPERIQRYHDHFKAGVKLQGEPGVLPFTLDHNDGVGAAGWITDVRIGRMGLEGLIKFTPQGAEAVASETYPFVSPDLVDQYEDPQSGQPVQDVLAGASLVVRPYFKHMPQVTLEHYRDDPEPTVLWQDVPPPQQAAAQEDATMVELDEVPTTLTEQPDAASEVAAEDAAAAASAEPDEAAEEAGDEAGQGQAQPLPEAPEAGETPARQFAEVVDAQQFAEMREQLEALQFAERVRQFSDELSAHSFGDARRLAPGPRDALATALAGLSTSQAGQVAEAVKAMRFYEPGEVGRDSSGGAKRYSELEAAMAAQVGLDPGELE